VYSRLICSTREPLESVSQTAFYQFSRSLQGWLTVVTIRTDMKSARPRSYIALVLATCAKRYKRHYQVYIYDDVKAHISILSAHPD